MKRLIISSILILVSITSSAKTPEEKINSIFSEWNSANTPGASVGVIKEGELVFAKGYGMANLEYNIPNNANSIFRIGSTSKQFTAACIVILAEQGKLSMDDSLRKYFPSFPDYANNITIGHLINHTSGIRDYLTLSYLSGFGEANVFSDEKVMKWLSSQSETDVTPGDKFVYSNSGYWLLGQIVEKVTGTNLADFAHREIFKPLGMNNTHFHNDHKRIVKNRASGYKPLNESTYEISMTTLNMIGDGGVFTSIEDIKKWDDAFYDNSVLSKEFWRKMTHIRRLNNGELPSYHYASGLLMGKYRDMTTISHGGAYVGYRAELLRFPEKKLSVAVFCNRSDCDATGKAYQVADVFLGPSGQIEKDNQSQEEPTEPVFVNVPIEHLIKYVGDYWDESSSSAESIFIKDEQLMVRYPWGEYVLKALSNNKFLVSNYWMKVTLEFGEDQDGKQTITTDSEYQGTSNSVAYTLPSYSRDQLQAFSGSYYSKELNTTYELTMENGELVLNINDSMQSPLKVTNVNIMNSNSHGTFTFIETDAKRISGFKLAARGVKNIEFTKI